MEPTYWATASVGVVVAGILYWTYAGRVKRERQANARLREIHENHLSELRSLVVDRLGLRHMPLPPIDQTVYSKVVDIYDRPELMVYPQRVAWARQLDVPYDSDYVYYWNVENLKELDRDELFVLWYEGVIAHMPEIAAALLNENERVNNGPT